MGASMPPSRGRIVTAILVGALWVVAGCNAILGLDEKERGVADGSDADGTDAPSAPADATDVDGDDVDAATRDRDAGCFAVDGGAPTFYGSCVPHVTAASTICNEYGTMGGLRVGADGVATQKSACSKLNGTWTDGPCDRGGAVFGCRSAEDSDAACASVSTTWYYPPLTTAYIDAGGCPSSRGTVIFP